MNLLSRSPWYEYIGPSEKLDPNPWLLELEPSSASRILVRASSSCHRWRFSSALPSRGGVPVGRGDSSDAVSGSSFPPLGPASECVSSRAERLKASHFTGETEAQRWTERLSWLLLPKIALFPRHAITLHHFLSFLVLLLLDDTLFVYQ